MAKIIAIIQARTGSSRLPVKVLLYLEGKTVLERVIERVKRSRLVNEVVVATTIRKEDLSIVRLCSSLGIRVYCGDQDDVLDRYFQAARLLHPAHIVRITADCPLIDAHIIDRVIRKHLAQKNDYTATMDNFPDGLDAEVFTFRALEQAWKEARMSSEREHVTPYINNNPGIFRVSYLRSSRDLSQSRWTLDEPCDYEFIALIYKNLCPKNEFFGIKEILSFLKRHPQYKKINRHIRRNEGYQKSLSEDKIVNFV